MLVRVVAAAAVASACLIGASGPATAAVDGTCPASGELATVDEVFDLIDKRIFPDEAALAELHAAMVGLDANEDGHLCWRQQKPNTGQDRHWGAEDYVVTFVADNAPPGRSR